MRIQLIACGALVLSLLTMGSATAQEKTTGAPAAAAPAGQAGAKLAAGDEKFVKNAAMGNMAEVQLGELVRDKASAPEVKEFAERMVKDHGAAQQQLQALATAKGVQIPAELDAKHKALADKMGKLSGPELDKAYMEEMLKDHKKDVSEYESALKSVKDPELKDYVEKTLPVLKEHLQMAQQHAGKGKGEKEGKGKAGEKSSSEKKGA